MKVRAHKALMVVLCASFPVLASAQQSEFNYIGVHGGVVGGPLLDDSFGMYNDYPDVFEDVDTTPLSYGIEGFRMMKADEDGIAFGFMLSGGAFTFEVEASDSNFPSWNTDYRYWGAGLLVGDILESEDGRKSTVFLGLEYLGLSADIEKISSSFVDLGGASISATTGALSVPFGFYSTLGESGLSGGIGGRYFVGDPNGFYEVFASIGFSF